MQARFKQQICLNEVGEKGQARLKEARVLCVGAGGLGTHALTSLSAMGVGHLGIIDFDRVSIDNLPRQTLYCQDDVGKLKTVAAKHRLHEKCRDTNIHIISDKFTTENALDVIKHYDIAIDASDNSRTKLLLNDACHLSRIPWVTSAVEKFHGYVMKFDAFPPCLRCLFPDLTNAKLSSCSQTGVMGYVPAIFGLLQAREVIHHFLGNGQTLIKKMLEWDLFSNQMNILTIRSDPACPFCTNQENFDSLANYYSRVNEHIVSTITVQELKTSLANQQPIFLLDVRTVEEHKAFNIGGALIPVDQIKEKINEIPKHIPIVVYCRSGHRSGIVTEFLLQSGFDDVKNLVGGMLAWE